MKIGIVNYGMGNIHSLEGAVHNVINTELIISDKYKELSYCDKLILPGVGHFQEAVKNIKKLELDLFIKDYINNDNKFILGICLGMQLLCSSSNEGSLNEGLNLIPATVRKFLPSKLPKPHIGYNQVSRFSEDPLYNNIDDLSDFYFVHNYRVTSDNDIGQSTCEYGEDFIASFASNNIFGSQFHPELSQINGLKYLKNFLKI